MEHPEHPSLGAYGEAVKYLAMRLTNDLTLSTNETLRTQLYNTFAVTLSFPPMALFDLATYRRILELIHAAERSVSGLVSTEREELPLLYDFVVNYAIGLRIHMASRGLWSQLVSIIEDTRTAVQNSPFLLAQQSDRLTADVNDPVYIMLVVMYEAVGQINASVGRSAGA